MPESTCTARLATLDQLVETTISNFISPVPSHETLREWFDAANIPRFKSNPTAKRGGGRRREILSVQNRLTLR
jgi:hypothetical protein